MEIVFGGGKHNIIITSVLVDIKKIISVCLFRLCAKLVDIYFCKMLLQVREDEYRSSLHHSGEMENEIRKLELEISGLQRDNTQLHKELHVCDCDVAIHVQFIQRIVGV